MEELSIDFKNISSKIIEASIIRLSYLFPKIDFSINNNTIFVTGPVESEENLKKEINYIVYREKIYSESLEIRKKIYRDL